MNYHHPHQCQFQPNGFRPRGSVPAFQISHRNRNRNRNRLNRPTVLPSPYQAFLSPCPPPRSKAEFHHTVEEIMAHLGVVYSTTSCTGSVSTAGSIRNPYPAFSKPPRYHNWKISKRMPKREVVSRWGAIHLGERKAPWDWWAVMKVEDVERENGRIVNGNRSGSGFKEGLKEEKLHFPQGKVVMAGEVLRDKGWPR